MVSVNVIGKLRVTKLGGQGADKEEFKSKAGKRREKEIKGQECTRDEITIVTHEDAKQNREVVDGLMFGFPVEEGCTNKLTRASKERLRRG